jgi:hypothetical protein
VNNESNLMKVEILSGVVSNDGDVVKMEKLSGVVVSNDGDVQLDVSLQSPDPPFHAELVCAFIGTANSPSSKNRGARSTVKTSPVTCLIRM